MCGCTGKSKSSRHTEPGDHLAESRRREWCTAFAREDEWRGRVLLALEPAQRPQLAAGQRVDGLRAALEPAHMEAAMGKIDGVPAQRDQLARPQAMAVGDQDHGGVAVAIAVLASCRDQPIDLGIGQVLARADLGVAAPLRWSSLVNCPINGGRRHQRQMRFFHGFSGFSRATVP